MTIKILRLLGCKVAKKGNKVAIDARPARGYEIPGELMRQMRSSVILCRCNNRKIQTSNIYMPRRM